jgi:tetratricopeptide (TPR) repeat protein
LVLAWNLGSLALAEDDDHLMADQTRGFMDIGTQQIDELVEEMGLPRFQLIEAMVLHEWAQFYLEWGEYDRVETLERQVLAIAPQFSSAYNNLSLAAFLDGNLPQAIDWSSQVLAIQPDNIHALANLVRYSLLMGQGELAQDYGQRLKQSQAKAKFIAVSDSALRRGSLDWDKLAQEFERIYDNYPHWCAILELLLDRGDPMGRETVLQVATALKRPALLEMLRGARHPLTRENKRYFSSIREKA